MRFHNVTSVRGGAVSRTESMADLAYAHTENMIACETNRGAGADV